MGFTRALVDSVRTLQYDDVPEEAREVGRQCLLDFLGCALAGAREEPTEILNAAVAVSMLTTPFLVMAGASARPSTPSVGDGGKKGVGTRTKCGHDETGPPICHGRAPARPSTPFLESGYAKLDRPIAG